jgi:hypothetical protein
MDERTESVLAVSAEAVSLTTDIRDKLDGCFYPYLVGYSLCFFELEYILSFYGGFGHHPHHRISSTTSGTSRVLYFY